MVDEIKIVCPTCGMIYYSRRVKQCIRCGENLCEGCNT